MIAAAVALPASTASTAACVFAMRHASRFGRSSNFA
jgi:hypothetical protein